MFSYLVRIGIFFLILSVFNINCTTTFKGGVSSKKNKEMNRGKLSNIIKVKNLNSRDIPVKPSTNLIKRGIASDDPDYLSSCKGSSNQYRQLSQREGAMARFEFDMSNFSNFSFNFPPKSHNCALMYLKMLPLSRRGMRSSYKGRLSLSYEASASIYIETFETNFFIKEETQYNRWKQMSSKDRTGKFYAIFYNKTAKTVILKLENVKKVMKENGKVTYLGDGELYYYYRMFRATTIESYRKIGRFFDLDVKKAFNNTLPLFH